MLQSLIPYTAHSAALKEMYEGWATGDSVGLLAKDAIFEGVGMYWTLRDSYEHWRTRNEILQSQGQKPISKTDVVKAWEESEKKKEEFSQLRAKYYLGKTAPDVILLCDDCYRVFNTHACQLGFVLTIATVVHKSEISLADLPAVFSAIVAAVNAALSAGPAARKFGRRTVLARGEKAPLNSFRKLDSPLAAYFRYFWLELLATPDAIELYKGKVKPELVNALRDEARFFYYDYLKAEAYKALKSTNLGRKDGWLQSRAEGAAKEQLKKALDKWFSISDEDFTAWFATRKPTAGIVQTVAEDIDPEDNGAPEEGGGTNENVDDILNSLPK
jgi:hypothetical protein